MDFDYVVLPTIIFVVGVLVIWSCVRRFSSLPTKSYRRWRKGVERIVLSLVVILVAGLAGSSAYNAIALHYFWATNSPPGVFYSVNGHKMHMYCTGSGTPTIVLEAGLGDDAIVWRGVQPALSKTTRVCAYDRAGLGWSDPLPPPRDADHIAADLHDLLREAKITGPVVLMGHSMGGIYLRDYASRYPENVAAAAIGSNHQAAGLRIAILSHRPPPAANRLHGEAGGIVIGAHTHPALVIGDVINSVRNGAAQFWIDKVVHIDCFRRSLGMSFPTVVFVIAH
jgi:alpha-beta hydrolase superfamily lysophospholipase